MRIHFDPIDYLVRRRYPKAFKESHLGTDDYTLRRQQEVYDAEAIAFSDKLQDMSPEELNDLVAAERKKEEDEAAEQRKSQEANVFFNRPDACADYAHWSRTAYWTLEEAVALSFGRDPRKVSWKGIEGHVRVSEFAAHYRDFRDIAFRAKSMGHLTDPVLPGFFIAWAQRVGAKFDSNLVDRVVAAGGIIADWKTLHDAEKAEHEKTRKWYSEKLDETMKWAREQDVSQLNVVKKSLADKDSVIQALEDNLQRHKDATAASAANEASTSSNARERTSMLKLIIGMAVRGYVYDPKATRNSAVTDIADDLRLAGVSLDEETIRKYLSEARDLLPPEQ